MCGFYALITPKSHLNRPRRPTLFTWTNRFAAMPIQPPRGSWKFRKLASARMRQDISVGNTLEIKLFVSVDAWLFGSLHKA
jgi:hypothetical protein